MKKCLLLVLSALLCLSCMTAMAEEKEKMYIAYIGGSITEGAGGSFIEYPDGTRDHGRWTTQLTHRYFAEKYPDKEVIEVNAGVGGTTSDLGLFRFENDVVRKSGKEGPDVLFIEFSCNDMYTAVANPVDTQKTMEGIVRQAAKLPKNPKIIIVSTPSYRLREGEPETGFQKYLESAAVHKEIADYYGLGYINLCAYVAGGVDYQGNEIVWRPDENKEWKLPNCWTGDGTHPNNDGYTGYTDYMIHLFETDYDAYFKETKWQELPMSGYEFGHPKTLSYKTSAATYTGTWENYGIGEGPLTNRFPNGSTMTTEAGATVTLKFKGRSIGIYSNRCSNGCQAEYIIDKGSANPITGTINNYYPSGSMGVATLLCRDLGLGEHTITITTLAPTEDAPERKEFNFGYFFVDEQVPAPVIAKAETDRIGTVAVGETITAAYSILNPIEEGASEITWLESDSAWGEYKKVGEGKEYTPQAEGKWVKYTVLPVNTLGTKGEQKESAPVKVAGTKGLSYESGYKIVDGARKGYVKVTIPDGKFVTFTDRKGKVTTLPVTNGEALLEGISPRFMEARYVMAYKDDGTWTAPILVLIDWDHLEE